ncbi:hypothetical protein PGIGA_G00138230 [Pangasianodon gigas]|uniref:Uncharacterized protein n=1 Tax=Pangasianodon gigas TaxID=30993 RepID=A0ACC5XKT6_PANGG|nr:hypothetical protein [Pangasianodon gigas]
MLTPEKMFLMKCAPLTAAFAGHFFLTLRKFRRLWMLLLKMILRDLVLFPRTSWRIFLCTCAAPLPALIEEDAAGSEESVADSL